MLVLIQLPYDHHYGGLLLRLKNSLDINIYCGFSVLVLYSSQEDETIFARNINSTKNEATFRTGFRVSCWTYAALKFAKYIKNFNQRTSNRLLWLSSGTFWEVRQVVP